MTGSQKRREQNRQSQRQYRYRKEKAYQDVTRQLEAERQAVADLRNEVDELILVIACLQKERNDFLNAVIQLLSVDVE